MLKLKQGDKVKLKRDIHRMSFVTGKGYREDVLYAKEGEVGEITEIFYPDAIGATLPRIPHAKVLIENQIKTFRLSSIEKV